MKKFLSKGSMLAAAGVIGISSMLSGCFGNDDKPGVVDTVNIMMDTGKAIINFGIGISEWEDDVIKFVETNKAVLKTACPEEMKKYEADALNLKKSNESGNDDEQGEALKQYTNSAMELLKKTSANESVDGNIRTEADTLAKRYDTLYDEMKEALTKSMPDAGKDEINKALDEAFKPAKK